MLRSYRESVIWKSLSILKGNQELETYDVLLFIITLHHFGYIDTAKDNADFIDEIKVKTYSDNSSTTGKVLFQLFSIYEKDLIAIGNENIRHIASTIEFSNFGNVSTEEFIKHFEEMLIEISSSNKQIFSHVELPNSIAELMVALINPSATKIYNPFATIASLGVALKNDKAIYYGQEDNERFWAIGMLRLLVHGKSTLNFKLENSFEEWKNDLALDAIISIPSFRSLRVTQHRNRISNESFIIEESLDALNANGELIVQIPLNFLNTQKDSSLRKRLVEENLIDTVIYLPKGLVASHSIDTVILKLSKHREEADKVTFIDATSFIYKGENKINTLDSDSLIDLIKDKKNTPAIRYVDRQHIRDKEYNLSPKIYFLDDINGISLGDFSTIIRGENSNLPEVGKVVTIKHLQSDSFNHELEINSVDEVEITKYTRMISESCVLVATRFNKLKPTYFEFKDTPIFLKNNDVVALKINETKVDWKYLINQLQSDSVVAQVEALSKGSFMPALGVKDLLNIVIEVPSLEEQKRIYVENFTNYIGERAKHRKEEEIDERLSISDENSLFRHEIAGALRNVKSALKFVQKITDEQIKINYPEVVQLTAHQKLSTTFEGYLNLMQTDLDRITMAVNRMVGNEEDQFQQMKMEEFDLIQFLKEYIEGVKVRANGRFRMEGEFQKDFLAENNIDKIEINADKNLLRNALDNLIENAEKHAFNYTSSEENRISIQLIHFDDPKFNEIQIDVCNNGNPLPKDITHAQLTRKGESFGENGGNGLGIWYVNKVMKLMGGAFTFTDETMERYSSNDLVTSMELNLPAQYIFKDYDESTVV
ncbi:N-6 DNA methylase [Empedobacter falsenii]